MLKKSVGALFFVGSLLVLSRPAPAINLFYAPDRLWMVSPEHGILRTDTDVRLVDAKSGTVSVLGNAFTAAASADRKSLLLAHTDREARFCELAEYDLSVWPPQLRFRTKQDVWVHQLAGTGIQALPYAAAWGEIPGPPDASGVPGTSLLRQYRDRDGTLKSQFEPIPILSCITADMLYPQSLLFCPTRAYTCAAKGELSHAAEAVLPKSAFIKRDKSVPFPLYMVVVVDGRKVLAYAVEFAARPVAFSTNGKRLLAAMVFHTTTEYAEWMIVDLDTGKLKKADFVPSGPGMVLAANGDLSAGVFRERFAVYLVKKKTPKKEIVRYPEPPEAAWSPPPSATTQEHLAWQRLTPAIAADFYNGTFFVRDGKVLIAVSDRGDILRRTALKTAPDLTGPQ